MKKIICFDLEGPLSPQDHAYEVMKLIPDGEKLFEVISRYDDLLTLEDRKDYEPGDTLKLIVPFLFWARVTKTNLRAISREAELIKGAKELIIELQKTGWQVFIISTSYEQHAFNIAQRLDVPRANVFCTRFPLDYYHKNLRERDFLIVDSVKDWIVSHLWTENLNSGRKDKEIIEFLDRFFWEEVIKDTNFRKSFEAIKVMGGVRKVEALKAIFKKTKVAFKDMVVVGDSITDAKMLKAVKEAGGLAIVFNGNEYALPYGTVGLASANLMDLKKILDVWLKGGRQAVKRVPHCEVLKTHQRYRQIVRRDAAKLG